MAQPHGREGEQVMDRVAQLKADADDFLQCEKSSAYPEHARAATRECLADLAREYGFPEEEIPAAIDTALGGR